jgi:multiple sugar transport system permease protein
VRLSRRDRLLLFAPAAVLLTGWLVLPAALGLAATFTTYSPFGGVVRFAGLSEYAAVLRDPEFAAALRNIAVFTVVAVPLELLVGFGLAYLLGGPMRGRAALRLLLLAPWLVSPIATGVMWHYLFGSATGMVDFLLGWLGASDVPSPAGDLRLALPTAIAIEVWRLAPFAGFLLLPGLAAIPAERWEDATLNGAGFLSRVLDVAVPALRPLLLAVAMLLIGLALGTFDSILILTGGGPGTATVTPALYSYDRAFRINDWPAGAASAWLITLGMFAVGAVYLRLARLRRSA